METYVTHKVTELDHCHGYGPTLRRDITEELSREAEDTFLWVSLVCKRLENVQRDRAMAIIQDLPAGLSAWHHQVLTQLCDGEMAVVKGCFRLLKVIMSAHRPLEVSEVSSVASLPDDKTTIDAYVDRCAS